MSTRTSPAEGLLATRIIAVVRGTRADRTVAVLQTLAAAGLRCLEVTLNTPGSLAALREARRLLGPEVELGAGTVLRAGEVDAVADTGASFIVAPDTRAEVAERAHAHRLGYYPGALTPTEISLAWELGASAVKVFPASLFGPGYLGELRGPFRDIPLLPTGGIDTGTAPDYLRAGALAVGLGGRLIGDALDGGSLDGLRLRAEAALAAIAGAAA